MMRSYAHTLALMASMGALPAPLVRPRKPSTQTDEQRERAIAAANAKRARKRAQNLARAAR